MAEKRLYGIIAEYDQPDALVDAARRAREAGYTRMDAFSPLPVHGIDEAMGIDDHRLPVMVLAGGVIGFFAGFGLMYWITMIAYPLNIAGRPLYSWPAFVPPAFETTILFAALTAVFGMIALNGLPTPYHPVFGVPNFSLASRDKFFLLLEARDQQFHIDRTRDFLLESHPAKVSEAFE